MRRGDVYCQITFPVSGSSAVTVDLKSGSRGDAGVEKYMTPPTISGWTSKR